MTEGSMTGMTNPVQTILTQHHTPVRLINNLDGTPHMYLIHPEDLSDDLRTALACEGYNVFEVAIRSKEKPENKSVMWGVKEQVIATDGHHEMVQA